MSAIGSQWCRHGYSGADGINARGHNKLGRGHAWTHTRHFHSGAFTIHPTHDAFTRVWEMGRNMGLAINDLAWLAIGKRGCVRHIEIDHTVVAAVDIVRKSIGMIVSLPTAIDQIAKLVALTNR